MSRILMIDDEPRGFASYRDELELAGYDVVYERDIDAGLDRFAREADDFAAVLLDIMMPPGERFGKDAQAQLGLRTGVRAFDLLREAAPNLPIVILTNVSDPDVIRTFRDRAACWFLQKKDYLPHQLVEFLQDVIR